MDVTTSTGIRQIDLTAEPTAASRARWFAREVVQEWGYKGCEDEVALAVTELVANAVVHARSATSLTLLDTGSGVQIRVRDDEPTPPSVRTFSIDDTNGRGMFLVESLSDHWGIEPAPPGKVVWLDIRDH